MQRDVKSCRRTTVTVTLLEMQESHRVSKESRRESDDIIPGWGNDPSTIPPEHVRNQFVRERALLERVKRAASTRPRSRGSTFMVIAAWNSVCR